MDTKKEVVPIADDDMFDLESVQQKFLKKHPHLTDEQRKEASEESQKSKKRYTTALTDIEDNLMGFLNQETPILSPITGEPIAMMRQIPYWEMMEMVPEKLLDENLSQNEKTTLVRTDQDIQMMTFIMMEKMISQPEHDAEWWKQNATPDFIVVFTNALEKLFEKLENDTSFLSK